MRWLFQDTTNQSECAVREEILKRIDAWWRAFENQSKDLEALFAGRAQWDLPEWMAANLQVIAEGLMWEYGPAVSGSGHRLVITPESSHHLRPLTATIIERAPKLAGWEFYPYRLAESAESIQATVAARTGGDLDGVVIDAKIGEHQLIDLTFRSPRTQNADDQQALHDAFVATETLLGEELLDKWIGAIEVAPAPQSDGLFGAFGQTTEPQADRSAGIRLDQLKEVVDSLIVTLRDQLPVEPHIDWVNEANWNAIRLEPEEAEEYPDRSDLITAITGNAVMWGATFCGRPFCSERFSRSGETFVYLKIDGSEGLDGAPVSNREEIEEALNDKLAIDSLGGVVGGGTGIRYSYIDLALTDLKRGIATVQDVLRMGRISKRSWVLFFDTDLCGEWVGIYDDTPPPPMPDMTDED